MRLVFWIALAATLSVAALNARAAPHAARSAGAGPAAAFQAAFV